jgi:hypothetical protein
MKPTCGRLVLTAVAFLAVNSLSAFPGLAQTTSKDQWIHVRVESKDDSGETVRVNVPVDMAVKVLPAIQHEPLHNGKVHIQNHHMDDVDLKVILEAVRSSKDGEYVTVQSGKDDVRVAKNAGYLYIHVKEKHPEREVAEESDGKQKRKAGKSTEETVEVKVPMKVVDALLSAGNDELDIVAALHALSSEAGDTELVAVKDSTSTVRIWIDSKNVSE